MADEPIVKCESCGETLELAEPMRKNTAWRKRPICGCGCAFPWDQIMALSEWLKQNPRPRTIPGFYK